MTDTDLKIDPQRAAALVSQIKTVRERIAAVANGRDVSHNHPSVALPELRTQVYSNALISIHYFGSTFLYSLVKNSYYMLHRFSHSHEFLDSIYIQISNVS